MMMRRTFRTAALVATTALALAACNGNQPVATYTNASGSLALSTDDSLLYAVDSDNDMVAIVDVRTEEKVAEVKVGSAPERIAVGSDDTLYVSNRGSRSVSVIRKDQWTEAARISVGVEPIGLAISPDNKTLYVVNSTSLESSEFGTLSAIDTRSNQIIWDLPVGEEPRGITLLPDNTALITLYKKGEVVRVDLGKPAIIQNATGVYEQANRSKDGAPNGGVFTTSTFQTRSMPDIVAMPDGRRAFAPTIWSREDAIATPPTISGGYYSNGGPCNVGAIATAGVVTFDTDDDSVEPRVDDLTACSFSTNSSTSDFPPSTLGAAGGQVMQGPVAAAVDPTGDFLFVVNRETNNVAILPTGTRTGDGSSFATTGSSVRSLVSVGAAPNGIALTRDGKRAYVYSQFDHSISRLEASADGDSVVESGNRIIVAQDTLPVDVAAGRRLFFSAVDSRMTNVSTGVSCNSCHPDAREDGHTWNFPDGPRQTPSLAGRALSLTGPYHWSGEFPTLRDFLDHTVRERMGGSGVTEGMTAQLAAFVDAIATPDNPHRREVPTEAQVRGRHVFETADCGSCHGGEAFTDNRNADVGTFVTTGPNPDDSKTMAAGLNVPSLLTLSRTSPYLHDGSAGTLKQRLMANKHSDLHGKTSALSEAQMDDLVEYLKSL